jgi:hypothetical protein
MITDVLMWGFILVVIVALGFMTYYFVVRAIGLFDHKTIAPKMSLSQSQTPFSPSVQEDTRDAATKKRVKVAIEKEYDSIMAKSLKRHAFECKDPWTCKKNPCYIPCPDKIVKETVISRPRKSFKIEE